MRRWLPFVLAALLLAPAVRAADDDRAHAKALYDEGQAEYNLGHFQQALEKYEGAYKIKPIPALLFNIAQCHRQLGDMRSAATTYKAYLRTASDKDPNRAKAETLLAEVEAAVEKQAQAQSAKPLGPAEGKQAEAPRDPDAPPEVEATPGAEQAKASEAGSGAAGGSAVANAMREAGSGVLAPAASSGAVPGGAVAADHPAGPEKPGRVWTWVAAGGTAAALAGGALFGQKSKSTASDLQSSPHSTAEINSKIAEVKSDASKANLLFAVSAALAVATGTFFVLEF